MVAAASTLPLSPQRPPFDTIVSSSPLFTHPKTPLRPYIEYLHIFAMDRCPPEILLKIFALACTDGGTTGCVLSLVSRYIREVSSIVQLQTVAVDRVTRMRLLLEALRSRPPALRRVKHLFLSDSQAAWRRCWGADSDFGHYDAYAAIMALVGQDLITLTVSLRDYVSFYSLAPPGVKFSRLQDLTVECSDFGSPRVQKPAHSNLIPGSFPNLRRLNCYGMASRGSDQSHLPLLNTVADAAPALAYLRLSGVHELVHLPNILSVGLRIDDEEPGRGVAAHRLPTDIQRIIVQPARIAYYGECDYGANDHCEMLEGLENLTMVDEHVCLASEGSYRHEDCLKDWLDVIGGGDGCWLLPDTRSH